MQVGGGLPEVTGISQGVSGDKMALAMIYEKANFSLSRLLLEYDLAAAFRAQLYKFGEQSKKAAD